MSAAIAEAAPRYRTIEIAPRINALYEPKGNLTFRYFNRQFNRALYAHE